MKKLTTMNEVWSEDNIGKTLFVDGNPWGEITDRRLKFGAHTIHLVIDAMRYFCVDEEKLYRMELSVK